MFINFNRSVFCAILFGFSANAVAAQEAFLDVEKFSIADKIEQSDMLERVDNASTYAQKLVELGEQKAALEEMKNSKADKPKGDKSEKSLDEIMKELATQKAITREQRMAEINQVFDSRMTDFEALVPRMVETRNTLNSDSKPSAQSARAVAEAMEIEDSKIQYIGIRTPEYEIDGELKIVTEAKILVETDDGNYEFQVGVGRILPDLWKVSKIEPEQLILIKSDRSPRIIPRKFTAE